MMRRPARPAIAGALALCLGCSGPPPASHSVVPSDQLPGDVRPRAYRLELAIDPRKSELSGVVAIDVDVAGPTRAIFLHAQGLAHARYSLELAGALVPLSPVALAAGRVRLDAPREVGAGPATLHARFEAPVSEREVRGVFRQREGDDWYAFTQFEATYARTAFPCFDEPAWKAPFSITLRVPHGLRAVGNMPIARVRRDGAEDVVELALTPPLPTYLVAFAVGPFSQRDVGRVGRGRIPVRILLPRGRTESAAFAASVTPRVIERLEAFFDEPFPYPKLDQVVVPRFRGAMENAGLVTYAETALLEGPGGGREQRRHIAGVIAHELAHHWLGNLVTPRTWDDLWLSEAGAAWFEMTLPPQLDLGADLPSTRVQYRATAMQADALPSARRLRQPVATPEELETAFDGITYEKGALVLEMIARRVGAEAFRRALRDHVAAHRHGSADAASFLGALSRHAGAAAAATLRTFLEQAGAPRVTVGLACEGSPRLVLEQAPDSPGPTREWAIPVCVAYEQRGARRTQCVELTTPQAEVPLPGACPAWVLGNDGFGGYYRTVHRGELLAKLLAAGWPSLSAAERAGLLDDAWAEARAGIVAPEAAFALVGRMAQSQEREEVEAAVATAAAIAPLVPALLHDRWAAWVRRTFGARARTLGWTAAAGEPEPTARLRRLLVPFVADEGEDPTLAGAAERLARGWLSDGAGVDDELFEEVLAAALQAPGRRELIARYRSALGVKDRTVRRALVAALGASEDRDAPALVLDERLDPSDGVHALAAALSERSTRERGWALVEARWDLLAARLATEDLLEVVGAVSGFCEDTWRDRAARFLAPRVASALGGTRTLTQALEQAEQCARHARVLAPGLRALLSPR